MNTPEERAPITIHDILDSLQRLDGLVSTLGIAFEVGEEEITCRYSVERSHTGAPGIAHGGAVMTLLDSALGACALKLAVARGQMASTVELKVNFLRPAREGQTLVTKTTIQSAGRSLLVLSGSASDEATGEQIAFAVGTFNLYESDLRLES